MGLALLGLVIFCYHLGAPGLMDPDEGRYAEIAREMWVLRDWLIPHLNSLPYLEKPPLVYWLTALSFGGLGLSELAARLPVAVSALGGLAVAYFLGRALWGPGPAIWGAAVLGTSAGYVALGRILTLDMTFALLLNLGVGLGYLALRREQRRLWLWAYGVLGLAVLTKGPVALVLAGLIWGLWVICHPHPDPPPARVRGHEEGTSSKLSSSPPPQPSPLKGEGANGSERLEFRWIGGRWRACRSLVQPWSWLLLTVVVLPWYAAVQWRFPDFFRFFIVEQHLGRYLTPTIHPEPFYYYGPVLLGFMLPWTWLLPWALTGRGRPRDPARTFLVIWAATILVFFSLSQGKLAPYVLPAALPLALLLGRRLHGAVQAGREAWQNRGLRLTFLIWSLTGWGMTALYFWPPESLVRALAKVNLDAPYLLAVSLAFAVTPLMAWLGRHLSVLVLGAMLMGAMIPVGIEKLSQVRSPKELGLAVKAHWRPGAALVGVNLYSQAMSFYSGQVFHLTEFHTELDFGRRLAPAGELFFPYPRDMAYFAQARALTFFYLKANDLGVLEGVLPGKLNLLARHRDCLLLTFERK